MKGNETFEIGIRFGLLIPTFKVSIYHGKKMS